MGAGIAQVAAQHGWNAYLRDVDADAINVAIAGITKRLDRLVEKGKLTSAARDAAAARLHPCPDAAGLADCELVVEAIVEDLEVKAMVLAAAAAAAPNAILATNTSSLSVSEIGDRVGQPARTVGMHFFNPVPLMPLVEVIAGRDSDPAHVDRIAVIAQAWGKTPARASDTPGFIVNRVARGYYLEPLRMVDEGVAGIDEIDATLKRFVGFRMGPFELMDLVGIDVNYPVSVSVYQQLGEPPRLKPSRLQRQLFEDGHLGRKTGRGAYSYESDPPLPALLVDRRSFEMPDAVYKAVRLFCDAAAEEGGSITEQYIFARTVIAIINEAALAVDDEVATAADIDTAMKLGTSYPHGPLEWAEQIGRRTCRHLLDCLNADCEDARFAPARWLRT